MKKLLFLLFAFALAIVAASTESKAQSQTLPTANKVIYTTNAVELQDSTNKIAIVFRKGTVRVHTRGFGGGQATFVEQGSGAVLFKAPVRNFRIVGVSNAATNASDSLKILSLKATPF
ncbi:hypothetical protein [Tellurirhabdus bombi]|uniref:hypothetical protein n=1 Tax=Tellurirhabdus bombi TaxID=2907205 RepID=UPI001F33DE2B|nr:hypothetical protein [Tellurirhabdus bombi]